MFRTNFEPLLGRLPFIVLVVEVVVLGHGVEHLAYNVLADLGRETVHVLQVAKELEKAALADPYFAEKKLFPNVDFYSGIILEAMGFPTSMFTPIFALSRTVGWISQWKEQLDDPQLKIGRPRQLYMGETERDYVDIKSR